MTTNKLDLYTSVFVRGDLIYYRGYDKNGRRVSQRIPYKPYLFINSKNPNSTKYKTLENKPVYKIEFASIKEAKEFIKTYDDVDGFQIYGMTSWLYPFINDSHEKEIGYRRDRLKVGYYDLEVDDEGGYAPIENPWQPITLIGWRVENRRRVFGWFDDYVPDEDDGNLEYIKCKNEHDMLLKFLDAWEQDDVDIISGWNIEGYDNTYIVNRIRRLFDDKTANRLSPWGIINDGKSVDKWGKEMITREIQGIISADYMKLYRKFTYSQQESYSLNHIAGIELKDYKVQFSGSLGDLMRNDYAKFVKYNAQDNDLVYRIDEKMNLLDQALTLTYDARIPFEDVFGTVKLWDSIIHYELMNDNIVVPPMIHKGKSEQYAGAFVKEPKIGRHRWIASFDVASLYPSLIVWGNFSPETYRGKIPKYYSIEQLLAREDISDELYDTLFEQKLALAANMTSWDKTKAGIFPRIVKKYLADRKVYKKRMLAAKAEYEKNPTKELEYEIARCNNMQMCRKIQLNSLYGAIGNQFFRYFQVAFAEAITLSGQLAIQWVEHRLNAFLNKTFKTKGYEYVIYVDTDSNYISLDPIVEQIFKDKPHATVEDKIAFMDKVCQQVIEPFIIKTFADFGKAMNAYEPEIISMKREALGDVGIWLGKKCYILSVYNNEGVQYSEPDIKMMGIAAVKSSTPKFCREKMEEAIHIMLQKNQKDLINYIDECRSEFVKLPFESVAFPRGVNGIKKYPLVNGNVQKGTPIHVKGALLYNKLIKDKKIDNKYFPISDGEKIKFSYLKTPNPLHDAVIASPGILPPEFGLHEYIDFETQFDKSFVEPVKSIAEANGWNVEEKADLSAWF